MGAWRTNRRWESALRTSSRSGRGLWAIVLLAMLILGAGHGMVAASVQAQAAAGADGLIQDAPAGPGEDANPGDTPVVIEAQTTQYQYGRDGTVVEASGNVRATYGDLFVSADYLRVNVEAGELLARGNVLVRRGSSVTRCSLFAYDLKAGTGRVLDPSGAVPGVYVRGKEMDVLPDRLTLAQAYATGCDVEDPCYRVTTRKLVIYLDRSVVAEWPVLWLEHMPVLVVPRLTIPLRGERVGWVEGEGYPVPKLAYDPTNGLVIGLSYLDRSREGLSIRYEGAYLTRRRGVQVEARAEARPGPGMSATVVGGVRSWEGLYASGECRLDLSSAVGFAAAGRDASAVPSGAPVALSLVADARYRSGTGTDAGVQGGITALADVGPVALKAVARKDVYGTGAAYSLPAVEATLDPVKLPGVSITLSGGAGRLEEPGRGVLSTRTFASVSVAPKPLRLRLGGGVAADNGAGADGTSSGGAGDVTVGIAVNARRAWYGTGDALDARTATISLDGHFGKLDAFGREAPRLVAGLDYTLRTVSGSSPFAFDSIGPLNQVAADMAVRLNQSWTVGLAATYDVTADAVKDLDLAVTSHHHCYDVQAIWREKRQEFGLEVRFTR